MRGKPLKYMGLAFKKTFGDEIHFVTKPSVHKIIGFRVFRKNSKKALDSRRDLADVSLSMSAEPLGFLGDLMLNSGGFFISLDLMQMPNWLCIIDSRPAGLLLSSGKVQLTSAGVFLPGLEEGAVGGV